MGQRRHRASTKSHTLPSSPTHSFSSSASSEFEFATALSPRKSSAAAADLCPADDLFYKGQLLPLHLSPRLSMVRTLLLSSASTSSSSDTTTTASRDSTASHSSSDLLLDCDSSRPSSAAADDDDFIKRPFTADILSRKSSKYFSLAKFSSVFRKETAKAPAPSGGAAAVKRASSTAREVLRKYLKKVKPLYEKLSHKQQQQQQQQQKAPPRTAAPPPRSTENLIRPILMSFSGNLSYPTKRSHISSCPSSMTSSPRHGESGFGHTRAGRAGSGSGSSMEELQSAIQGAIAHCKNSMLKNNSITVSNEILL